MECLFLVASVIQIADEWFKYGANDIYRQRLHLPNTYKIPTQLHFPRPLLSTRSVGYVMRKRTSAVIGR